MSNFGVWAMIYGGMKEAVGVLIEWRFCGHVGDVPLGALYVRRGTWLCWPAIPCATYIAVCGATGCLQGYE
jgi:hypothetical protein